MKAIGYIRVSTDDQARKGVSLAVQQAKIEAYAMIKDWTLVDVIRDEGASAKSMRRPGLQRLLAFVQAGVVEAVITYKLDRLSRRVRDVYDMVDLFERTQVSLVSLEESLDATTAMGRAMIGLLAVMSQLEREVISERTAEAMQYLKAQGKVYSRPVCDDADTLARIQALRAAGASYQEIADTLTREGVPTVRGGRWQAATILGIVRRHQFSGRCRRRPRLWVKAS